MKLHTAFQLMCLALLIVSPASLAAEGAKSASNSEKKSGPHEVIRLWKGDAPNAVGKEPADIPTLTIIRPDAIAGKNAKTNSAIVICPGGGYRTVVMSYEGVEIGEWFASRGVTAFVLKYRIAPRYKHPTPMLDVQRAIRTVRAHAKDYDINPEKIGVMGFSAGGHLASTAGTHFDAGDAKSDDVIQRASSRPDFMILCYPVISMKPGVTHGGSRKNLLGDSPKEELVQLMSNESQVTKDTPPTFLFHTLEDQAVPAQNSVDFYSAMVKAGVPGELHVYEPGRHGVGLSQKILHTASWPKLCENWLKHRKLIDP